MLNKGINETIKKHFDVITAYMTGAQIQYFLEHGPEAGTWQNIDCPAWRLDCEYRVKPEEKTTWLNVYPGSTKSAAYTGFIPHKTKKDADKAAVYCKNRVACLKVIYFEGEGL